MPTSRKAQATVYIILAILVIVTAIAYTAMRKEAIPTRVAVATPTTRPAQEYLAQASEYVRRCIADSVDSTMTRLGDRGALSYHDDIDSGDGMVGLFYSNKQISIPKLNELKTELEEDTADSVTVCLDAEYDIPYELEYQPATAQVTMTESTTMFVFHVPTKAMSGRDAAMMDTYTRTVNVGLPRYHRAASRILEIIKKTDPFLDISSILDQNMKAELIDPKNGALAISLDDADEIAPGQAFKYRFGVKMQ